MMNIVEKSVMSDKINVAMMNGSIEEKVLTCKLSKVELNSSDELSMKHDNEPPSSSKDSLMMPQIDSTPHDEICLSNEASLSCESTPEELKNILKQELETIFSQENFSKDKFLISQLDSDQYILLDIIMHLKPIECLTTNPDLILELLKELPNLQVDPSNTKVRLSTPRSTIILREVPHSTPKEDIEGLFEGPDCPQCVRCEFAGNENWYITFLTEVDAHKAYNHLRENVQSFLGKPIMARIKTSNTFISSSGKTAQASRFHPTPVASDSLDVLPQPPRTPFSAQASAALLSNYFISQPLPFYSHEFLSAPIWSQKFMESYNLPMCQDLMYTQPIYGYSSQDGATSLEGNSRHKSSNSAHFRTNHHCHHRSQADFGGGGSYFNRYSGSHNENRPPPRFLRQQQMANMASNTSESSSLENHGLSLSSDDYSFSEKSSLDSRPAQNAMSVRQAFPGNDKHISNGFVKTTTATTSCKLSPEDKDRDGFRGKRFSERRGGYRASRKHRNVDDGDKNMKSRQPDSNLKSPKSKDIPTFVLESSSFPPLTTISNTSSTSPITSCGPSYVQAVSNSSQLHSYNSSQLKLPHGVHCDQGIENFDNTSSPPTFTSEPLLLRSVNICADVIRSCKMPLVKLSYAQIAQRTKFASFKNEDNEGAESASSPVVGTLHSKADRTNDKNFPQQTNWIRKKPTQNRKNGENFKSGQPIIKNACGDDEDKCFKPVNDLENGRQSSDKLVKAMTQLSQHGSTDEAEDRLVKGEA